MLSSNTSAVSGDAVYVEDVFSTYTYTGNVSSPRNIVNNIDLATKGGLVWIKSRTYGDTNYGRHVLSHDATTFLTSNSTVAAASSTNRITAFNSDGFTLGNSESVNDSAPNTYASWTFRKQPKFFDIQTFVSNSSYSATINHNLQSVPGCVIIKNTSVNNGEGWYVYHRSIGDSYHLVLNTTAAKAADSPPWITVSSTQISFNYSLSGVGQNYVAYIFAHDAGGFGLTGTDNVISCGSYTGTGSAVPVSLGYEPQWLLVKKADGYAADWVLLDTMRGMPTGGISAFLAPNLSNAENATVNTSLIDVSSTGFNVVGVNGRVNESGAAYIYIAIRKGPMKVPTDATKVFHPLARTGNDTATTSSLPFTPDALFSTNRTKTSGSTLTYAMNRLNTTGANGSVYYLGTNVSDAETSYSPASVKFDVSNGVWFAAYNNPYFNNSPLTYINWLFKRAPSFMDVVCYTGTGSYPLTINHNLGVIPELMIFKKRSASDSWYTYAKPNVSPNSNWYQNYLILNGTNASAGDATSFTSSPTSTTIQIAGYYSASGATYVAYLFATCPGVSKVGSYTGTGTTLQVNCGFTSGARFVLIKRTDSTGDWYVWDTARGIVSGNDPYLLLNSTVPEDTSTDYIDTYSAGFEISSTAPAAINASGGTFIFLAVA